METVISKDGSRIAYDRYGAGPTVILVGGALSYRRFKKMEELAKLLAERFTVINYDRRGRGDSTEVKPFALEREIEDVQALLEAAGGSGSLWGWSSGGALALRAAGAGLAVERISVYEVPFMVTPGGQTAHAGLRRAARRAGRGRRPQRRGHALHAQLDGDPGAVRGADAADADVERAEGHRAHAPVRSGLRSARTRCTARLEPRGGGPR